MKGAQHLGQALMPLVADPQLWIHRIVESVSFIDAKTIRRARSFDFTVPEGSLIKLAYSEPLESAGAKRDFRQLIGWSPAEVAFEVRAAGEAASYHFELAAPTGGIVRAASLAVATDDQSGSADLPSNQIAQSDAPGRLVHLHLIGVPRTSAGKVLAQLVPARSGWLASATFAAWSTAVILVAAYLVRERLALSPDSSVTLLLVSNGLVSAVLSRPLSHDLTAAISRGPRLITLAAAVSSYSAAFAFVADASGAALGVALIASWTTALVSAVVLTRSWLTSS